MIGGLVKKHDLEASTAGNVMGPSVVHDFDMDRGAQHRDRHSCPQFKKLKMLIKYDESELKRQS